MAGLASSEDSSSPPLTAKKSSSTRWRNLLRSSSGSFSKSLAAFDDLDFLPLEVLLPAPDSSLSSSSLMSLTIESM